MDKTKSAGTQLPFPTPEQLCKAAIKVRQAIFGNAAGTDFEGRFGVPDQRTVEMRLAALQRQHRKRGIDCTELAAVITSANGAIAGRPTKQTPASLVAFEIAFAAQCIDANNTTKQNDPHALSIGRSLIEAHQDGHTGFLESVQEHLTGARRQRLDVPGWHFTVIKNWCPAIHRFASDEHISSVVRFWPGFAYFKFDAMLRCLWDSDDENITRDALRGFIRTRRLVRAKNPLVKK